MSIAVHAGGAREYNFVHFVHLHHPQQVDGPTQVVIVVLERLAYALTDSFQSSEVYHAGRLVLRNDLVDLLVVLEVSIHEFDILSPCDLPQPLKALYLGVVQVVQKQDVVALINQLDSSVRADVPETARHQNALLGWL